MKVTPEFPPQSPDRPVIADKFHEPAPAPVMSMRSAYVIATVAAVKVIPVPGVALEISILFVVEFPLSVRVPEIVWLESKEIAPRVVAGPLYVNEENVFAPVTKVANADVRVTVPQVLPPPAKFWPAHVRVDDAADSVPLVKLDT